MGDGAILRAGSDGEEVVELALGGIREPVVAGVGPGQIYNTHRDPDAWKGDRKGEYDVSVHSTANEPSIPTRWITNSAIPVYERSGRRSGLDVTDNTVYHKSTTKIAHEELELSYASTFANT